MHQCFKTKLHYYSSSFLFYHIIYDFQMQFTSMLAPSSEICNLTSFPAGNINMYHINIYSDLITLTYKTSNKFTQILCTNL